MTTRVPPTWATATVGVLAFQKFCADRLWPFVEVPTQHDFGKDGYVDLTQDGEVTGDMFAVQVKAGVSYRTPTGYKVPVDKHASLWRDSPVAVIGIVHDPESGDLYWANLSAAMRQDPERTSVDVESSATLADASQVEALIADVAGERRYELPVGLGALDIPSQIDAVWECFALARRDPVSLVVLRRCFLSLQSSARLEAAVALSFCTPHPDVAWTKETWLPPPHQNSVRAVLRWTESEVLALLDLVDPENALSRGSIGQCVLMLLLEDPDLHRLLFRSATTGWGLNPESASWAATVLVALSKEQTSVWADLRDMEPALARTQLGQHVTESLDAGYTVGLD